MHECCLVSGIGLHWLHLTVHAQTVHLCRPLSDCYLVNLFSVCSCLVSMNLVKLVFKTPVGDVAPVKNDQAQREKLLHAVTQQNQSRE